MGKLLTAIVKIALTTIISGFTNKAVDKTTKVIKEKRDKKNGPDNV
jgi:hypothetical protein